MIIPGNDTALYHVTEAYDMKGLTPRFNLTDPSKQKYRSTVSDGAPWKVMEWINDEYSMTSQFPGPDANGEQHIVFPGEQERSCVELLAFKNKDSMDPSLFL